MAQWIEQFRPKEKVVRSTRTRVTNKSKKSFMDFFNLLIISRCEANFSSLAVGAEQKSRINSGFFEATPGELALRQQSQTRTRVTKFINFCYIIHYISGASWRDNLRLYHATSPLRR